MAILLLFMNAVQARSKAYKYKELDLYHGHSRLHPWMSTSTLQYQNSPTICKRIILPKSNTAASAELPLPKPNGPAEIDSTILKDGQSTELSIG